MTTLRVLYPIYTLDKQQLLSENTQNLTKALATLISSSSPTSYKRHSLLKYGSVRDDLMNFLYEPNYQIIFADRKKALDMLSLLGSAPLILPLLESFDYFKYHDFYTYRHILIVFALSTYLSMDLLPDSEALTKQTLAGPNHDFGKLCVPFDVLQKTNPITRTEKGILEHHAVAGYVLLSYYYRDMHNSFAKVARDHHERRNGSGYPRGIKLKDLIVEIVAISDIYDALISPRPYRSIPYDNRTALEEITTMAENKQLRWKVVKALIACNRKSKPHYSICKISCERRGTPPAKSNYGVIVEDSG